MIVPRMPILRLVAGRMKAECGTNDARTRATRDLQDVASGSRLRITRQTLLEPVLFGTDSHDATQ